MQPQYLSTAEDAAQTVTMAHARARRVKQCCSAAYVQLNQAAQLSGAVWQNCRLVFLRYIHIAQEYRRETRPGNCSLLLQLTLQMNLLARVLKTGRRR
jgi:hypothetical protein